MIYPTISACILHSRGTTPGRSKRNLRLSPDAQVPRMCAKLLSPEIAGQRTLCATVSLFLNTTVAPCGMTRTLGSKLWRSEEHTSELQSRLHLVCRLLLEKKKKITN